MGRWRWMVLLGRVGSAPVLSNCESGSGASLDAPFGGGSVRTGAHRPRVAKTQPVGIAKSDRPRSGWVATPGGIQPSDRRHIDQRRFADVLVVMAGMSVCAS